MRAKLLLGLFLLVPAARAKEHHFYQKGTLTEMNSADCGYEEKGAKGVTGVLLGTDSEHVKTKAMLCPEYTLRADKVTYRIRPKDEKHPALLPVGEQAEFWIGKDRMHLLVPEGDRKEREYWVVSMTPRSDSNASKSSESHTTAQK